MSVEIIEITGHMSTRVTAPRVRLGVEASVQKIQRLIWIHNVAKSASCATAVASGRVTTKNGGCGAGILSAARQVKTCLCLLMVQAMLRMMKVVRIVLVNFVAFSNWQLAAGTWRPSAMAG